VVFPTWLDTDQTHSEAGFDVIPRDIHVKKGNAYYGRPNPQYPMHRFVDMSDGDKGFAIINDSGLREYEAMDSKDRPLAITLVRSFIYRNCPAFGRYEAYPEMELSQVPGPNECSYAIYLHTGDWTNGVFDQAETLNLPLEPAQAGPHKGTLPKSMSFLELQGGNLQLTAFKRAEDRKSTYIVRIFNPETRAVNAVLKLWKPVKKAWLTDLDEDRIQKLSPKGNTIRFKMAKKRIATVEFGV
jgi:alpha-mannosidase